MISLHYTILLQNIFGIIIQTFTNQQSFKLCTNALLIDHPQWLIEFLHIFYETRLCNQTTDCSDVTIWAVPSNKDAFTCWLFVLNARSTTYNTNR